MAFRNKKKDRDIETARNSEMKVLDVNASMQGSLTFGDAVNLRINGKFEGNLDTKGCLTIGENAYVRANIIGEDIVVSGKVFGNVTAAGRLTLTETARLTGDICTHSLSMSEGAFFQGKCQMSMKESRLSKETLHQSKITVDELAKYLEVDSDSILEWAQKGKIPAHKESGRWSFDRAKVDAWIASEKIEKK